MNIIGECTDKDIDEMIHGKTSTGHAKEVPYILPELDDSVFQKFLDRAYPDGEGMF